MEFSEIGKFIDMPVKHYSSGMYVRLGFAIAAHVKPDVLLLDEVLAVGDMSFIAKCFKHLNEIKQSTAIILVTHDMRNVSRFCDKALLLSKGKVALYGSPKDVIDHYRKESKPSQKNEECFASKHVKIKSIEVKSVVQQKEDVTIKVNILTNEAPPLIANISIHREDGTHCFGVISDEHIVEEDPENNITLCLNKIALMPGNYSITAVILEKNNIEILAKYVNPEYFTVIGSEETQGVYLPEHKWITSE